MSHTGGFPPTYGRNETCMSFEHLEHGPLYCAFSASSPVTHIHPSKVGWSSPFFFVVAFASVVIASSLLSASMSMLFVGGSASFFFFQSHTHTHTILKCTRRNSYNSSSSSVGSFYAVSRSLVLLLLLRALS